MLNKIVKLIGIGVIIGLNGLSAWGSDDYEIWDSLEAMQNKNTDFIAKECLLFECRECYQFAKIESIENATTGYLVRIHNKDNNLIGFYLNLPPEIIKACKRKRWAIYNEDLLQKLQEIVSSEENFHVWCFQQSKTAYANHDLLCCYAYILPIANQNNYFVPAQLYLYDILVQIYYGEATFSMLILPNTLSGWYLRHLEG